MSNIEEICVFLIPIFETVSLWRKISILVCKVIISNSFKIEITYKLSTYKSYMYLHKIEITYK